MFINVVLNSIICLLRLNKQYTVCLSIKLGLRSHIDRMNAISKTSDRQL